MTSFRGKVRNLWLRGNGSCAQTAIHGLDTSYLSLEDLQITNFVDPGSHASVGVQNDGREGFNMRNVFIQADSPVVMGKNPNHPIDADHVHIEDLYSIIPAGGTNWHITLDDDVLVSNMTIDGQNALVGGCGALKWVVQDGATASVSSHLKISNVRTEQLNLTCDKTIYIDLPTGRRLLQLVVDNVALGGPFPPAPVHSAIHLNNVDSITVSNTSYFNHSATIESPANFIRATNAMYIQLVNNYFYVTSAIVAPGLTWKEGPYSRKDVLQSVRGEVSRFWNSREISGSRRR